MHDRGVRGWVIALTVAAAAATVVAYWLPIFQVGGFVYRMIDFGGRSQFVAGVTLPIVLGLIALVEAPRYPRLAPIAGTSAAAMATLVLVDHVAEAASVRADPERRGAPFEFRWGVVIATLGVAGGAVVFATIWRTLASDNRGDAAVNGPNDLAAGVATIGLLMAIAGQIVHSSRRYLWDLPVWLQAGAWWQLLVTSSICGLAVWRRSRLTLAAAVPASIVAAARSAQEVRALSMTQDDLAVSAIVRLVGFALVMVALTGVLGRLTVEERRRRRGSDEAAQRR
jgi:hypothetical protein